jgi:hypothetical protein
MDSSKTRYYIPDWQNNKIYILNDEYQFISQKSIYYPIGIISIGNNMYISGYANVWKTDKDLNVLLQFNKISGYYDIYYNSTNSLMYITAFYSNSIHVFDLNLNLVDTISTPPFNPWSISGLNNRLYAGYNDGSILVIENKQIINNFNGCGGTIAFVTSIIFDQSGYMATSCITGKLYLYDNILSFTGKSISTAINPISNAFDSKGRFVVVSANQISIYY